jgi:hypothetical protein
MKEIQNKKEKTSEMKDYLQGIFFLVLPIIIVYLIMKYF